MRRVCPLCLNLSDDDAERCACGYAFDTGADNPTGSMTVQVVRQAATEDEYAKFYQARLEQAQADLKALIARHGKSGWTPAQRAEIEQAIQQVSQAKADWDAQRARTDDAEKKLEAAKTRVELRQIDALTKKKI